MNHAAEQFLNVSRRYVQNHPVSIILIKNPAIDRLIKQTIATKTTMVEHGVHIEIMNQDAKDVTVYTAPFVHCTDRVVLQICDDFAVSQLNQKVNFRNVTRSISHMAALMAHEIKNPLSGIRGAAQLLEDGLSENDKSLTNLIVSEVERIKNLVDRIAMFDEYPMKFEAVNIHSVLDYVRNIAEKGFASHIQFETFYDPSLPNIQGDRELLIQVFLNLIKNAAEALENQKGSRKIRMITGYEPGFIMKISENSQKTFLPLAITIRDNGPGIPESIRQHLFEPFVTGRSKGTGLGLALCGKIINDHGGIIDIKSQKGQTDIRIFMPLKISIS